jgi:hypothetical protein
MSMVPHDRAAMARKRRAAAVFESQFKPYEADMDVGVAALRTTTAVCRR